MRKLVDEVTQLYQDHVQDHNIKLLTAIESSIPEYILSDPIRLKQILKNLIGNAVKFTKHGHISVKMAIINKKLNPKTPEQTPKAD